MSWINGVFGRAKEIQHLEATYVGLLVPKSLFELFLCALQLGELGIELREVPLALLNYLFNEFLVFRIRCKLQSSLRVRTRICGAIFVRSSLEDFCSNLVEAHASGHNIGRRSLLNAFTIKVCAQAGVMRMFLGRQKGQAHLLDGRCGLLGDGEYLWTDDRPALLEKPYPCVATTDQETVWPRLGLWLRSSNKFFRRRQ